MVIYIITFLLTILFTYFAQCMFNNKKYERIKDSKKLIGIICSIFAILLPSIIAGVRDESIGIDVNVYMKPIFERARLGFSFVEFNKLSSSTEYLYNLLTYLVALITNNFNVFMFLVEFIIVSLVYLTIYRYREKGPMWIGMMVFLLIYYNRSLNIIRQSMALAITFYSTKYLKNRNYIKYIITIVIATLFHTSAFVAGLIYIIYIQLNKNSNSKKIYVYMTLVCILVANYGELLKFLIYNLNVLPSKYAIYIPTGEIDVPIGETLLKTVMLLLILIYRKSLKKYNIDNAFFIFIVIIDFILMQIGIIAPCAQRVSFYFGYYYILLIPQLYVVLRKKGYNVINFLYTLLLITYWYYMFVKLDNGTYPYTSTILGIF